MQDWQQTSSVLGILRSILPNNNMVFQKKSWSVDKENMTSSSMKKREQYHLNLLRARLLFIRLIL